MPVTVGESLIHPHTHNLRHLATDGMLIQRCLLKIKTLQTYGGMMGWEQRTHVPAEKCSCRVSLNPVRLGIVL